MFDRFKSAVTTAAEHKSEIRLITVACLIAGPTVPFMIYVVGYLAGLVEW